MYGVSNVILCISILLRATWIYNLLRRKLVQLRILSVKAYHNSVLELKVAPLH